MGFLFGDSDLSFTFLSILLSLLLFATLFLSSWSLSELSASLSLSSLSDEGERFCGFFLTAGEELPSTFFLDLDFTGFLSGEDSSLEDESFSTGGRLAACFFLTCCS